MVLLERNLVLTADWAHVNVHDGHHFEVHVESGAATVSTIACAFKVPSGTKETHMVIDWKSSDRAHVELIEGATWDTNTGTVVMPYNNNRQASVTTTSQLQEDKTATPAWTANGVLENPSNIAGGTVLHTDYVYVPAGPIGAAPVLPRHEWVLKNDSTYVIRITKDTAGAIYMGTALHWYEHVPDKTFNANEG